MHGVQNKSLRVTQAPRVQCFQLACSGCNCFQGLSRLASAPIPRLLLSLPQAGPIARFKCTTMRNQLSKIARLTGAQRLFRHLGSDYWTTPPETCRSLTSKSTTEPIGLARPVSRLEGKVAVVTGGASGIGEAIVRKFVREGARVVIADIQNALGTQLAAELGPAATLFVHTDVTKEEHVAAAVDAAVGLEGRLDIMVNNSGIVGALGPIDKLNLEEYDYTLAVNLRGVVLGVKHAARVMKAAHKGSIVCTGSAASLLGGIGPHCYTVSKRGIDGLVKTAAFELRSYGVRINMVSPDYLPSPLTAAAFGMLPEEVRQLTAAKSFVKGEALTPDGVAGAITFLASDDSAYITGHNLVLDGGRTSVASSGLESFVKEDITFLREAGIRSLAPR